MTRKLLVVTAALLIIFSLQAQARSGGEPHQKLQTEHRTSGLL